jgi:hypothetical protein
MEMITLPAASQTPSAQCAYDHFVPATEERNGGGMRLSALLPPIRQAAAQTPPDRNRLIDAVRGLSLIVVVIGHLGMAMVYWPQGGKPVIGNLLASYPLLQGATWILQVIPLFFMAGGAVNLASWQRAREEGVSGPVWIWGRIRRLYRPVLLYLAVLAVAATAATLLLGPASEGMLALSCQMLWFLGIYLLTTLLLPAMAALHERSRFLTFALGVPLAITVNLGTTLWGWPEAVGLLNYLLVWLLIQQLGFLWEAAIPRRFWVALGAASLALSLLLVSVGPWPASLVGIPGEPVSNMAPPSIVLMLHGFTLVSLVYLARPWLEGWLRRPRPWTVAVGMSMMAMTIYLWHVPAMILAFLTMQGAGWPAPTQLNASGVPAPTEAAAYAQWWVGYLVVFLLILTLLVLVVWPAEHGPWPIWDTPARLLALPSTWPTPVLVVVCGVGGSCIGLATLALSIIGYAGFPTKTYLWFNLPLNAAGALAAMIVGMVLVRSAAGRQPSPSYRSRH